MGELTPPLADLEAKAGGPGGQVPSRRVPFELPKPACRSLSGEREGGRGVPAHGHLRHAGWVGVEGSFSGGVNLSVMIF